MRWLAFLLTTVFTSVVAADGLLFTQPTFNTGKVIESTMMHQDAKGAMWFAELGALHRFDGREVETYTFEGESPDVSIAQGHTRFMFDSADGRLWAVTGATLQYFEHHARTWRTPVLASLQGRIHWADSTDGRRIWIVTDDAQIAIYEPLTDQLTHLTVETGDGVSHSQRWEVAAGDGKAGYFGVIKNDGVYHFSVSSSSTITRQLVYRFPSGAPYDPLKVIYDDQADHLYLIDVNHQLTVLSVNKQTLGTKRSSPLPEDRRVRDILLDDDAIRFFTDRGVESLSEGVLQPAILDVATPETGLRGLDLAKSDDGLYWLSSLDEPMLVGAITEGTFLNILDGDPRFRRSLYMTEGPDGDIIIAASGVIVRHDPQSNTDRVLLGGRDTDDAPPLKAMSLLVTDAYLYIGTLEQGLLRYNWSDGGLFKYPIGTGEHEIHANGVTGIIHHSSGAIVITTFGGGVSVINGDEVYTPPLPVADNHTAFSLMELDDGSVFIPAWEGFLRLDPTLTSLAPLDTQVQLVSGETGEIPHRTPLWGMTKSRKGTILAGSTSVGLLELEVMGDRAEVRQIDTTVPSPYEIKEIEPSQYLISSPDGLLSFNHVTGVVELLEEQLQLFEFTQGCALSHSSGTAYFCSTAGPIAFDELPTRDVPEVTVGVSSVFTSSSGAMDIREDEPLIIDSANKILALRFFAADYRAPAQIRFEYRLRGYQDAWVPLGTEASVAFSQLPVGDYMFEVAAQRAQGEWNREALQLPVSVKPVWWQSWPLRVVYLSMFATLVFLIVYVFRSQRQAFRQVESELRVALQEQTRQTEVERIGGVEARDTLMAFKTQLSEALIGTFAELRELARIAGSAVTKQDRIAAISSLSGAIAKAESRIENDSGVPRLRNTASSDPDEISPVQSSTLVDPIALVEHVIRDVYGTHYCSSGIRLDFIGDAHIPERVEISSDDFTSIMELLLVGVAEMMTTDTSVVVRLHCLEDDLIVSIKELSSDQEARQRENDYFADAAKRAESMGGELHWELLPGNQGSLIQVELPCRSIVPRELELESLAIYAPKDDTQSGVMSNALLRCGYRCEQWSPDSELDDDGDVLLFVAVDSLATIVDQTNGAIWQYPNVVLVSPAAEAKLTTAPSSWIHLEEPVLTLDLDAVILR